MHQPEVTLRSQRKVTIPSEYRDYHDIEAGDKIVIIEDEKRMIRKLGPKNRVNMPKEILKRHDISEEDRFFFTFMSYEDWLNDQHKIAKREYVRQKCIESQELEPDTDPWGRY